MAAAVAVFVDCYSVQTSQLHKASLCSAQAVIFWQLTKFTVAAVLQLSRKNAAA